MGAVCDPCSADGLARDNHTQPLTKTTRPTLIESSENLRDTGDDTDFESDGTPIPISPTGDLITTPTDHPYTQARDVPKRTSAIETIQRLDTAFAREMADEILDIDPSQKLLQPALGPASPSLSVTNMSTRELNHIASMAYDAFASTLRDEYEEKLVDLKGWLEKKQSAPPYSWQRRWVCVKDGYLLWSDRQITIEGTVDLDEVRRWNKAVNLKHILEVVESESKKQRKFKLTVKDNTRAWIWKAATKKDRDDWIKGLNDHIYYEKRACAFNVCPIAE
eukprot:125940_1